MIVERASGSSDEELAAAIAGAITEATDGAVQLDECTVCVYGNTYAGKTFWFDGAAWTQAQQKTAVQQAPLFNVYDVDSVSFGDRVKYQSSDFATWVNAEIAVISVGAENDYGHPAQETISLYELTGSEVFRTDLSGDIAIIVEDTKIWVAGSH